MDGINSMCCLVHRLREVLVSRGSDYLHTYVSACSWLGSCVCRTSGKSMKVLTFLLLLNSIAKGYVRQWQCAVPQCMVLFEWLHAVQRPGYGTLCMGLAHHHPQAMQGVSTADHLKKRKEVQCAHGSCLCPSRLPKATPCKAPDMRLHQTSGCCVLCLQWLPRGGGHAVHGFGVICSKPFRRLWACAVCAMFGAACGMPAVQCRSCLATSAGRTHSADGSQHERTCGRR